MMRFIDALIDKLTMYKLVLYTLIGLLCMAIVLASFHLLPYSPLSILLSTGFLLLLCWATNILMASMFSVPANIESMYITALILALIITPAQTAGDYIFLGWAAILAMSSKYILAFQKKHLFNPAAIAVVITALATNQSASWWVGTAWMLPVTCVGSLLIIRKMRLESMAILCFATVLLLSIGFGLSQGSALLLILQQVIVDSPVIFFIGVMLTEPYTLPPRKAQKILYGILIGVLFVPQVHIGTFYFTPELALVTGNLFSYCVSPKSKLLLRVQKHLQLSPDVHDLIFRPSTQLAYLPGQYMEWTLPHDHADSRGNRRFFTLASSPTERTIRLGVKLFPDGSSYKKALEHVTTSTSVIAGQLAGDFTLPRNPKTKLVFIAGGIGITPFRSMIKYLLDTNERRPVVLFYVARQMEDFVYSDVFTQAVQRRILKVVYTLTDTEKVPESWKGRVGRVTGEMLIQEVPDYQERIYYISGPPAMVRAFDDLLIAVGISRNHIKKDYFPGL